MSPDNVNGLFEFFGSIMIWRNVYAILKDKHLAGVRWGATAFFSSWGFWNLYYYPSLNQWWSFSGGVSIVIANTIWLVLSIYYSRGKA